MNAPLRAALLLLGVGILALSAAGPVEAQEWRIYLLGKVEPIVADYYVEDTPWVFFHDDQSMYLFAVGCNRIDRVERAGAALPKPACPVDRLPTTMPRIYIQIMDLEGKRLDDSIAKLREQTRAYAEAVFGSVAATRQLGASSSAQAQAQIELTRALGAISFLQSQISDTLLDIRLSEARVGALLDATKAFPQGAPQRYYFFAR